MRLIDTRTMMLKEFYDDRIPKYAILSHTWGEEEVSFKDFEKAESRKMKGYSKIQNCCRRALKERYRYLWVDTCCIDKSSSAELSEAINSMFKWYKDARICYAYLVDVPEQKFVDSRWFTRGWTLQELLAPRLVSFFNQDWDKIGTKSELIADLELATGIDSDFLKDLDMASDASVAQKFSWAAQRKTTRTEDVAYCLMGLFDINMPLLYGEGAKAFIRLQHEIIKVSDDESIFAWCEGDNLSSGVFASSPLAFIDSGDIIGDTKLHRRPYMMTNKGLSMDITPLNLSHQRLINHRFHSTTYIEEVDLKGCPFVNPIFLQPLDCLRQGRGFNGPVAICVSWMSSNVFQRHFSQILVPYGEYGRIFTFNPLVTELKPDWKEVYMLSRAEHRYSREFKFIIQALLTKSNHRRLQLTRVLPSSANVTNQEPQGPWEVTSQPAYLEFQSDKGNVFGILLGSRGELPLVHLHVWNSAKVPRTKVDVNYTLDTFSMDPGVLLDCHVNLRFH